MLEWITVILLVAIGVILIIAELIFVPGTTIVGVLGLVVAAVGIWLGFDYFGAQVGFIILMGSGVVSVTALIYALKSNTWERFANKKAIRSKFNEDFQPDLAKGDIGETVSALRPIGKAEFNDKVFEVKTNGNYLEAGNKVQVVKVGDNQIIVELYNQE